MTEQDRRRAEALYRESTELTARALASHGYTRLPDWLRAGAAA
jgi:hypothetical protein